MSKCTFSGVVVEDAPAPGEGVLAAVNLEPAVEYPEPDGVPELIDGTQVIHVQLHLFCREEDNNTTPTAAAAAAVVNRLL